MEAFNNDDIDMIEYDEDDEEDAPEQYVPHNQIHLIKRSGKNCILWLCFDQQANEAY